jgi:hypothetical protein
MDRLRQREGEKVEGKRDFNFSFRLPERATFKEAAGKKEEREVEGPLPASMMEAGAGVSVIYELEMTVKRGAFGVNNV